jgi:ribosomal protein S19E (S16A)
MVILDTKTGRVITTKGRKDVQEQGVEVFDEWIKKGESF